jgi:hypothetical protein
LPQTRPQLLVIDTQSLFDWLVFRNPVCANWAAILQRGDWQWIFTAAMKAEFDFVAAKGFGERWPVPAAAIDAAWARLAHPVEAPAPQGAMSRLRCTDPDDQKFIDAAIATGAHTLVSRDKALLRLARQAAQRHGLRVCTPAAWSGEPPSATNADA